MIYSKYEDKDYDGYIIALDESLELPDSSLKLEQWVETLKKRDQFDGKAGTSFYSEIEWEGHYVSVALVGIGNEDTYCSDKIKVAMGKMIRKYHLSYNEKIVIDLSQMKKYITNAKSLSRNMAEMMALSQYSFDTYKTDKKDKKVQPMTIDFVSDMLDQGAFDEGLVLGQSAVLSSQLTNLPSCDLTPSVLASKVEQYAKDYGFEAEVLDFDAIEALNMGAYLAVARASVQAPKLIVMRYRGGGDKGKTLGLVGKGLTYDSGGLSIKPTSGMADMKSDMGGASAVIGAMTAIAKMKLKINVTAVVAACENMISGDSYRPGDIITSMAGKTIYIGNTDAEGRLTLIDGVNYVIEKENADYVVDIATLTGSVIHSLGHEAAGIISNHDDFCQMFEKAAHKADEKVWKMPTFEAYKEGLKHKEADLTNIPKGPGMIMAGLFIGEFVKDKPWVHVDIAGTAYRESKDFRENGGTGYGVSTLYHLAKKLGN